MSLRMYGATDRGLVRSSNQDALFFSKEYGVVIVSDGMGGHKGGEIASRLVVEGLRDAFLASSQILLENLGAFLDDVLRNINAEILRQSEANEKLRGMGATVNYLQFAGGMVAIGHAGDSRTYLLRLCKHQENFKCHMWQLTVDHNVGTFAERGLLKLGPLENTLTERQKSRLMRGMGVTADLKADLYTRKLMDGDVLLTCSDGLHGYVAEEAIIDAMCAGPLENAPQRLIELAKSVGAPDNITTVISVWSDADEPLIRAPQVGPQTSAHMVRMPNGVLHGPISSAEIVRKWIQGSITFESEVAAHGKPWVFLRKHESLYKIYPEFDLPAVRQFIEEMAPPSTLAIGFQNKVLKPFTRKSPWTLALWGAAVVAITVVLTLAALTLWEFAILRDTTLF